jgi:hypothetical protein
MWTTSVILKILVKVNNHPMGENSPNLVTLVGNTLKYSKEMNRLKSHKKAPKKPQKAPKATKT